MEIGMDDFHSNHLVGESPIPILIRVEWEWSIPPKSNSNSSLRIQISSQIKILILVMNQILQRIWSLWFPFQSISILIIDFDSSHEPNKF